MSEQPTFRDELAEVLNRWSIENGSNTPDFLLADFLIEALRALDKTMQQREEWYGRPFHQISVPPYDGRVEPVFPEPEADGSYRVFSPPEAP